MDLGKSESQNSSKKSVWQDISDEFRHACNGLDLGELVYDTGRFGLFDAMSAIEIMDPKMDAGMVCKKNREVLQLKDAVGTGKLKVKDFTVAERIGIMDELLSCFVTWLDGHSLVQTVYTCLYVHDPLLLEDSVLKAYCLAILKLVECLRSIIERAKVFEEEDFQTASSSSFLFIRDLQDAKLSGMMKEVEDETSKQIKVLTNQPESENEVKLLHAVRTRLKLLRSFYAAVSSLSKPECSEVEKAKESLSTALGLVDSVESTLDLGALPHSDRSDNEALLSIGFDPLVNQRLLPPSFPRQVSLFTRQAAVSYFRLALKRLQHVCLVTQCNNVHHILEFVCEFSRRIPCVLSRSILQFLVWHNSRVFGKLHLPDMLRETIKSFNSPPILADMSPLANSPVAKDLANAFLARAARTMTGLLHAYGHNRARQRERLGDLLKDLDRLQEEADSTDSDLNGILTPLDPKRQHLACFGSWVLYHSLSVLTQYILLGFELELFSPHEFHYVYWYLDYLFGWSISCLSRADWLLTVQEQHVDKRCGKKDKRKKKEYITAYQESRKEHSACRALYDGMKCMALGLIKVYEGFEKESRIKKPRSEIDNEQVRFEHRFMPFTFVDTPEPIPYQRYLTLKTSTDRQSCTSSECFDGAKSFFERAISTFQHLAKLDVEGAKLLKVAKTNFVVSKLACSGHKRDSKMFPEWDFSVHQTFPVVKLL